MDPIQQPTTPTPQPGQSLDDLIYKTMPRPGSQPMSVPTPLAKEVPVPTQPIPAPKPVMPEPPKPPVPGSFSAELKPMPAQAPSPTLLSDIPKKRSFHMTKPLMYASGAALLLIIALVLFLVFKPNDTTDSTQVQTPVVQTPKEVVSTQIPDGWRLKYFGAAVCTNLDNCGDAADPDHDGLINLDEYLSQTDPNNGDSDADGIADGDEVHLFALDPTNGNTSGDSKYLDAAEVKAHWNAKQKRAFNDLELTTIAKNIVTYGLHSPTIATVGQIVVDFYTNYAQTPGSSSQNPSLKPGALDRDTQRSDTIKQLSFALLKYKQANSKYPDTNVFGDMLKSIKPLLTAKAINTTDPTNVIPYVYGYASVNKGVDFKLTYFSETQNQLISMSEKEAQVANNAEMISQRDTQRKADLDSISSALELYANENTSPSSPDVHLLPSQANWKKAIAPDYITVIPTDPSTKKDYEYSISTDSTDFALQTILENPPAGKKGYVCTATSCEYY